MNKEKQYVIGVDIGNTKTSYALVEHSGQVLAKLKDKGTNYQNIGEAEMRHQLQTAVQKLLKKFNISAEQISFIYFGAAGADSPEDFIILNKSFAQVLPDRPFDFENDGWIALHNGTFGNPGMVVTCGTANTNCVQSPSGKHMRIGGLCEFLGDVLGGHAIASYTLIAAMRSEDGRDEPTILTSRISKAYSVKSLSELVNMEIDDNQVRKILPILFSCALEYDGKALEICWNMVKEVLKIVNEFYNAMFRDQKFTLVLEGSVFKERYQPFTKMIELALHQKYDLDIVIPDHDAVLGAVFLALKGSGVNISDSFAEKIIQSYQTAEQLS